MSYNYFENGTYLEVDGTGAVYDVPGNCAALRLWCSNSDCYFILGSSTLALASCLVPASSGDPCSAYAPNQTWVDVNLNGKTKIAIKSGGTLTKVWMIPTEVRA